MDQIRGMAALTEQRSASTERKINQPPILKAMTSSHEIYGGQSIP